MTKSVHIISFLLWSSLMEGELGFCFFETACQLRFLYYNPALPTPQALGNKNHVISYAFTVPSLRASTLLLWKKMLES